MSDRYQITLHAENLPNTRRFWGTICPYATLRITTGTQKGQVLGKTETLPQTQNPEWTKIFIIEFADTDVTNLEITIMDDLGPNKEHKWIGEANFETTSVYQSPGKTQSEQIGRSEKSRLCCHIEKSIQGPSSNGQLELHLRGLDMKNVEPGPFGLGRSDPFFEVAKKDADYSVGQIKWNTVYRSEHIDDNLNPYWKPKKLGLEELCYGKLDWPLRISVYDHNRNGNHRLIGEFETSIDDLQTRKAIKGNADREQAIALSVEEKYKTYGLLCVLKAEVLEQS